MIRILFAVLTLLAIGGTAVATCQIRQRVVVHRPAVVVAKAAVVVAAVEAIPVAVYQAIPAYGASYIPHAPAPTASLSADTQAILDALRSIDARLKRVESVTNLPAPAEDKATPAPAAGDTETKARAILGARCASCHSANKLNAGTTFAMFAADGKINTLTDRQWGKIGSKIATGKMPPPKKDPATGEQVLTMPNDEAATVAEWLDARK